MLVLLDKLLDWLPGSGVIYLTAAATGLTIAASEISQVAPEGSETAVAWLVRVAAWLSGAAAIFRRGTEVAPELRGFTPLED